MGERIGLAPGQQHGLHGSAVQCTDIQIQGGADACDVRDFLGGIRHDRRPSGSQEDIGDIIDGDVIGDAVDQRRLLLDIFE